MLKVYLTVFFLAAAVFAESVRETEMWVRSEVEPHGVALESSGDFEFPDEEQTTIDDEDDDDDGEDYSDYYNASGSGDEDLSDGDIDDGATLEPEELDNHIPDADPPRTGVRSGTSDEAAVQKNEIGHTYSVLQNKAEQNIFNKTEVLAAVIAGGAVGLLFAVLLILLLVYRMKKKDEGSYELGKKPIYKKAPTAEIYA
ncbi:syndecan-4 [Hoplias malabaricus]|uniref:syndecan-4 n=1 Tax=Hoplias malabaricus TaxID=27720 RepID=UPI00346240D6